jgi:hypothetical protein
MVIRQEMICAQSRFISKQPTRPDLQQLTVIVLQRLDEAIFARSLELMTSGGSAIARGVVISPFVFASTARAARPDSGRGSSPGRTKRSFF